MIGRLELGYDIQMSRNLGIYHQTLKAVLYVSSSSTSNPQKILPLQPPHYLGAFLDWSLSMVVLCNHFVGKLQHLKFTFFLLLLAWFEANISFLVCVCVCFFFLPLKKFCNILERFKLLVLPKVIFPQQRL